MNADAPRIRPATPEDAAALAALYAPYVRETAVTFDVDPPSPAAFRDKMTAILERYPYLVAEQEGRALGYAYAGPFVGRAAYDWAAETSVYVARGLARRGVGGGLYRALEACLGAMGVLNLYACIAWPEAEDEYLTKNSADFHRHLGFRLVGEFRRCGCKFGRWYGMVWMEKLIGEHPARPAPVRPFPEVRAAAAERCGIG